MPDDASITRVAAAESLLSVADVGFARGNTPILDGVSVEVAPGEIVTLIGPNGAGKTTLVRIALGLLPPDRGRVTRRAGLVVGYMPQRFHIDESMPLTVRRFLSLAGVSDPRQAIEDVGIGHLLNTPIQALSGGETQRALLARALLRRPHLLVLDEPVRGVDVGGQFEFYDLIARLRRRRGCGILMVSHDLHLVMAATDRVVCLNRHVCCAGQPEAVSEHPEYLALFGPVSAKRIAVYAHHHDHRHGLHGEVVQTDPPDIAPTAGAA
jgi:zinc transport system ATP-binding protein